MLCNCCEYVPKLSYQIFTLETRPVYEDWITRQSRAPSSNVRPATKSPTGISALSGKTRSTVSCRDHGFFVNDTLSFAVCQQIRHARLHPSCHPAIATPAHGKCASVDVPHIVSDSENGLFERYDTLGAGNSTYSNTDVSKVKS